MKKSTKGARQALKRSKDTAKRGHKQGKDPKINPAPSAQALESRQRHSEGMLLMSGNGNVMCAASPAARAQPLGTDWTHRHAADGACMPQRRRPPAPPKGAVNSGRRERHAGNGEDAAGRPGGGRRGGSLQCPCCAPAAGGGGCV